MMSVIEETADSSVAVAPLCKALNVSRATFYRHHAAQKSMAPNAESPHEQRAIAMSADEVPGDEASMKPTEHATQSSLEPSSESLDDGARGAALDEALHNDAANEPNSIDIESKGIDSVATPGNDPNALAHATASTRTSPRALSEAEERVVLDVLHSQRFNDKTPREIYATLLDEGIYYCSVRTMYRILKRHSETRERRNQRRHPVYAKPELLATGPNQVWSWDITKLRGPAKWTYFYLYVIIDIFSRAVVGWMVATRESHALAARLIDDTCARQDIVPDQLTLHADRGSSMRSKTVALLLSDLGVTKTHSRPHTSNDNAFSESQFKTMKYRPEFPKTFGCLEDARAFCGDFFDWYNHEHYHSGLGLHTPNNIHTGLGHAINENRKETLAQAYCDHPERFVNGPPQPLPLPEAVWINRPKQDKEQAQQDTNSTQ